MIDLNALEERLRPWREAGYEFTWGTEGDEVVVKITLEGHEIWHDVFYPEGDWWNRVLDEAIERGVIRLDVTEPSQNTWITGVNPNPEVIPIVPFSHDVSLDKMLTNVDVEVQGTPLEGSVGQRPWLHQDHTIDPDILRKLQKGKWND